MSIPPFAGPLGEAIEAFLGHCGHGQASEGTADSYRHALGRFLTAAGVADLEGAKGLADIRQALRKLEAEYQPATVALTISVARQFYKALQVDDRSIVDPTKDIKVKIPNNVPEWNVLHHGDPAELLGQIKEPRDRAILMALMLQGWRVSELCTMTWKNLRQEKERWVIEWKAKGKKLRTQALQPAVLEAIRAMGGKVSPTAPLFPKRDGSAHTRHDVYGMVTKHSKLFGKRVTPHGLRATYVSSVIARKGIEAARQLAGHKSINTTQRYSRWVVDSDDELTVDDL